MYMRSMRSIPIGGRTRFALRIERLDLLDHERRRRCCFDLVQKALPVRPLLLGGKLQLGNADLVPALASDLSGRRYPMATPRRHWLGHSGARLT